MANPEIIINQSNILKASRNKTGDLTNSYSPFQNLTSESTELLGDFTTEKLNFDLEHPVDIITQDNYDGSVNLILNDGKNTPKLINSKFSIQNDSKFLIPDHYGYKDTNIYEEKSFNIDTSLKAIPINIPKLKFLGLVNQAGILKCGSYTFYFKLSDSDGNETEVVQESGIVQLYIGEVKDPSSIRMGLEDESTSKSIKFRLSNIDSGFDYVHVLFTRSSSGNDQAATHNYYKIEYDYPIINNICELEITGNEKISEISDSQLYTNYADINSVKTQTINNNVLLFGNINSSIHNWDALRRMSWKIVPGYGTESNVGYINSEYKFNENEYISNWSSEKLSEIPNKKFVLNKIDNKLDPTADCSYGYYNPQNIYYKVGYWPDEIYRFGIVYIFEDMSLSPVFNIQGVDFSKCSKKLEFIDLLQKIKISDTEYNYSEWEFEPEDKYFNKELRLNSRGVIKFPKISNFDNGNICKPKPLYIHFDLSNIGKYINNSEDKPNEFKNSFTIEEIFKFHKIKGFFFVRQRRIPTILAQGLMIGLTKKDFGSLPVIQDEKNNYISESFLSSNESGRLLNYDGRHFIVNKENVTSQAMFIPDAEMMEATFNQIFVGNQFALNLIGNYNFKFDYNSGWSSIKNINIYDNKNSKYYKSTLLNVPEDTKILTDGTNYFSTLAGNASEPYKTSDLKNIWNKTKPQDLTNSDTLVRGQWGSFVGVGTPENYIDNPYKYGEIYNIKNANYADNEDNATELDFQKRFNSSENYSAICDRMEFETFIKCYRGDCFQSMFTHRVLRNFIDPELPTNDKIVNPACWASNYGIRCTTKILSSTKNNLMSEEEGWYISSNSSERRKNLLTQSLVLFLTGNIIGSVVNLIRLGSETFEPEKFGLSDNYAYFNGKKWYTGDYISDSHRKLGSEISTIKSMPNKYGISADINTAETNNYYLIHHYDINDSNLESNSGWKGSDIPLTAYLVTNDEGNLISWDHEDINQLYPNGFSNEICQAFEVYVGDKLPGFNIMAPLSSLIKMVKYGNSSQFGPAKKKVNPKEQEQNSKGLNLKAIFKSDENWDLRGLANINRADVNAVGLGQWITFPICSTHNLALRDIDYSNVTEQAQFARKRGFYPLKAMDSKNPMRDSNVINQATAISIPNKKYYLLPNIPFIKQEYFTRIVNSLHDSVNTIANEFKVILDTAYADYTKTCGSITKLISFGNNIVIVFKHGVGVISLNLTSEFGPEKYLPVECTIIDDKIGSMWKDSIISTDSGIYGVDTVSKKIWKCDGLKPLTILSDHVVSKFLIDNINMSEFITSPYIGHINVKTHYNKFKHDIIFTYYNDIPKDINGERIYLIGDDSEESIKLRNKIHTWEKGTEWALCYNEHQQTFTTFYDWYPLESENIDNIYFSFDREQCNEIVENDFISDKIYPEIGEYYQTEIKKFEIDPAFNHNTDIYYNILSSNNKLLDFKIPFLNTFGCLSFYCKSDKVGIINLIIENKNFIINVPESNKWISYFLFIKSEFLINSEFNCSIKSDGLLSDQEIFISDIKYKSLKKEDYEIENKKLDSNVSIQLNNYNLKIFSDQFILANNFTHDKYWEIRNSENNIKLWKHGKAGLYKNESELKPTNWYGKQHEFNFEFIVNKPSALMQKIYNNLKIISNKSEPYKFEYEVVGEGYDWYLYKPIIEWCNEHENEFNSLEDAYKYVMSNTLETLYNNSLHPDFPILFNKPGNYIIKKLPFLKIKLSDRKGTKMNNSILDDQPDMYKDNTSETILIKDDQLSEYRIHTEQLGNDIKKYGRIRGNMQYLEDLWNIEIRPIAFKYAYIDSNQELKFTSLQETKHRDKYIKIKIRYTGKDLTVIQGIITMLQYSLA